MAGSLGFSLCSGPNSSPATDVKHCFKTRYFGALRAHPSWLCYLYHYYWSRIYNDPVSYKGSLGWRKVNYFQNKRKTYFYWFPFLSKISFGKVVDNMERVFGKAVLFVFNIHVLSILDRWTGRMCGGSHLNAFHNDDNFWNITNVADVPGPSGKTFPLTISSHTFPSIRREFQLFESYSSLASSLAEVV